MSDPYQPDSPEVYVSDEAGTARSDEESHAEYDAEASSSHAAQVHSPASVPLQEPNSDGAIRSDEDDAVSEDHGHAHEQEHDIADTAPASEDEHVLSQFGWGSLGGARDGAAAEAHFVDEPPESTNRAALPRFANEANRKMDREIASKEGILLRAKAEFVEHTERVAVMRDHLKNVEHEIAHTQAMLDAKARY